MTFLSSLWKNLQSEAKKHKNREPLLAGFLHASVLAHKKFAESLCTILAQHIADHSMGAEQLEELFEEIHAKNPALARIALQDLQATVERDPLIPHPLQVYLFMKGFHALQTHRIAHILWQKKRKMLAYYLQSRCAEIYAVDIHPAAKIGHGIMLDHATGIVIGETAIVGNNVSMLHNVTLGGDGKNRGGDRHPKIGHGVLLGVGSVAIGNIKIGANAKVAAGSVVLEDVPPHITVAGVPAKRICKTRGIPAKSMNQQIEE